MWHPGHMEKSRNQIKKLLKAVNYILLVLDARSPIATTSFEKDILENKKVIYLLNKADISNKKVTEEWKKHFLSNGNPCLISEKTTDGRKIVEEICSVTHEAPKNLRILVAGVPNVGKSSIINKLSGKRNVIVGARPGVTRGVQWIILDNGFKLLDSPGILYSKIFNKDTISRLLLIGSILPEDVEYGILDNAYGIIKSEMGYVENSFGEFMENYCKSRNFKVKGNEPDIERGISTFLKELSSGKLGRFSIEFPSKR
jgi:ribosome biogenesis GTPase A